MTIRELYDALDARYPVSRRCPWDNDGLMVCADPDRAVSRVMLALDPTAPALEAAAREGCEVLLTHHPLLFRPLNALNDGTLNGVRVLAALKRDVAVMSFHTRLDAAPDGVNDALVSALGLVPDGVFGDDEAPEIGRLATLDADCTLTSFARCVKDALDCPAVRFAGVKPVRRIALLGGSGKDFLRAASAAGADTFVTGEVGYNAELDAVESGLNLVLAGHYYTEAPVLRTLADVCTRLGAECRFFNSNTFAFL